MIIIININYNYNYYYKFNEYTYGKRLSQTLFFNIIFLNLSF